MIKGNDNTRFSRKLECVFWWILRLFPVILMIVLEYAGYRSGNPPDETLLYYVELVCPLVDNNIVLIVFEDLLASFGVLPFVSSNFIFQYMAYLVVIELCRFFLNFFLFIIRFANHLFERWSK